MHSLETIIALNSPAASKARAARTENEITRHCSFKASRAGIVLHSAIQRNTLFLKRGKATIAFNREMGRLTQRGQDLFIESYFS